MCKDLSLGYKVEMSKSPAGHLRASNKRVVEVSLVKTGAREKCHIHGWEKNKVAGGGSLTGSLIKTAMKPANIPIQKNGPLIRPSSNNNNNNNNNGGGGGGGSGGVWGISSNTGARHQILF